MRIGGRATSSSTCLVNIIMGVSGRSSQAFTLPALVSAGQTKLAREKLTALSELVQAARSNGLPFGFNEWHRAQDGTAQGQDWQTWSAAMYIFAATCVEENRTAFFSDSTRLLRST